MKQLKKGLMLLSVLSTLFYASNNVEHVAAPVSSQITITVDGEKMASQTGAIMSNGSVLVPLKDVFNQFNVDYSWKQATKQIMATMSGKEIDLQVNRNYALINNQKISLNTPPTVFSGTTYVPLRFISECLGLEVKWDGSNKNVSIQSDKQMIYYDTGEMYYYGQVNDAGQRNGYGKEYAKTGALIYEGQWEEDVKEGKGKFIWENMNTYEGQIKAGEANGQGILTHHNVGTYTGTFVNGKREGQGTFKWNNGDQYIGNWENDQMNGKGKYSFSSGICYEGTFKENKMIEVSKKYKE